MEKTIPLLLAVCLLLSGCGKPAEETTATAAPTETPGVEATVEQTPAAAPEQSEPAVTVQPLPDTTMDNLTDAILSVSLEEGDAYVDDTGIMRMDVTIYTYDKYDMVDIAQLKVGDILVTHAGEVQVTAMERSESGILLINGGLEEGGLELVTDDSGIFFETGFNDAKNWYALGEATIRVSADFMGSDQADPAQDAIILYPGSFLVGEVTDYNFTPYNTTIRVAEGQIVELKRIYTP